MLIAKVEKISANKRTALLLLVATAMIFVLFYVGDWLIFIYTEEKGMPAISWVKPFLYEVFILVPLIAISAGLFIGYFEQKKRWWVSGLPLMPFLLLVIYNSLDLLGLAFVLAYLSLSLVAGLLVSRRRKSVETV